MRNGKICYGKENTQRNSLDKEMALANRNRLSGMTQVLQQEKIHLYTGQRATN